MYLSLVNAHQGPVVGWLAAPRCTLLIEVEFFVYNLSMIYC